jgi:large repetitive protein
MNKVVTVFLAAAFLSICSVPGGITKAHPGSRAITHPPYVEGEVLVKMRQAPGLAVEPSLLSNQLLPGRGAQAEPLNADSVGSLYLIHLNAATTVEEAVAQLKKDPRVEYAEPDYLWHPADTIPNDPDFLGFPGPMWGLLNIGNGTPTDTSLAGIEAPRAWDLETGEGDIVVAVPDEGVDISHQDLQANVWVNPNPGRIAAYPNDVNGWNFIDNNNQVFDPTSDGQHGTHVSGTIGAVGNNNIGVTGVAWHVQLMPLKFIGLNKKGVTVGSTHNAVRAIDYAIKQKKLGINVRIINASWDGPGASQGLRDAIIAAGNAGILFVCAASNNDNGPGQDMDTPSQAQYPGAWNDIPTLISVAAVDETDNLAGYSEYGHATVTVAAPGGANDSIEAGILSTVPGNQYAPMAGTSMASPHVAGIAVLLADHEPALTAAQIKQRIFNTARPVLSLASMVGSSGRADAFYALTNQVAPINSPTISVVTTTKKVVTVDGLGFVSGSSLIYVNGVALPTPVYDSSFAIGNGTLTQLSVKLGKAGMASTFPAGTQVTVTVVNPASSSSAGQSSAPFSFTNQ